MTKLNCFSLPKINILLFNVLLTFILGFSINTYSNGNISNNNITIGQILKLNNLNSKIIVLDPGHGGKDSGTSFERLLEKDITLALAKKIKKHILNLIPDIKVVLTREADEFIPLFQRIEMANRINADLFISIHCNSYIDDKTVNGIEIYTLGLTESEENLNVASRENTSIFYENNYENNYEWHDPNSIEAHIFLATFQSIYMDNSILIANNIGKFLNKYSQMKNRGVKQSGFVLLKRATMPSVLIETGFLSNKSDRNKLINEKFQMKIAKGVSEAIKNYFEPKI